MTTATNNFSLRRRAGFILPFALVVTTVSAITAMMFISYFNGFNRNAYRAAARTRCRLAAQSVIEQTKIAIQNRFEQDSPPLMRNDPMMVSVFCDWFASLNNASTNNVVVSAAGGLEANGRTILSPVGMDGCTVYVGILPNTAATNATEAILPITATAELTLPDKQRVTVTVMEQVRFYAGHNQVFNYAYFANNYGWMNANNERDLFNINGDFRANGNVSINGSVVNGFIYAATNPNIGPLNDDNEPSGVPGTATVDARHWGAAYYRSNASKIDVRMRPTDPISDNGFAWLGGYDAPATGRDGVNQTAHGAGAGTRSATAGAPLVSQGTHPIEMPMISDLDGYVKYAKQRNGTLKCPGYSYIDSAGNLITNAEKNIVAYYSKDDLGPSKNNMLNDKGALVLRGTQSNPIVINGPVVVHSDVIVSGYIKGQGVIYCGRNVHVVGDVRYVNGPDFSSVNQGSGTPEAAAKSNKEKDLVCFIAKGNVVLGDCSKSSWMTTVKPYITTEEDKYNTSQHDCDSSDADIGYNSQFKGNYNVVEEIGSKAKVRVKTDSIDTGKKDKNNKTIYEEKKTMVNTETRRYYETVCDDAILSTFARDITRLDGVFYNNHCVMGTVGDSSSAGVTIFGSLVCRNEAIIVSTQGRMYFNWDNRLREGSPSYVSDLPLPLGLQIPHTYAWQEISDSLNPIFKGQRKDLEEQRKELEEQRRAGLIP